MISAGLFGNALAMLAGPWLTARETAALIMVVISLLFVRGFREWYLLAWGAGWTAYGAFLYLFRASALHPASRSLTAFVEADFVLAIALFAAAAPISARSRRALTVLVSVAWVILICAAMRPFYFPDYSPARLAIEIASRLMAAGAAIALIRARLGRIGAGPLLFAAGLLT